MGTIKALLFIQSNRPDIYDVGFLQNNHRVIHQLAAAYNQGCAPAALATTEISNAVALLKEEQSINLHHVRESCTTRLQQISTLEEQLTPKVNLSPLG